MKKTLLLITAIMFSPVIPILLVYFYVHGEILLGMASDDLGMAGELAISGLYMWVPFYFVTVVISIPIFLLSRIFLKWDTCSSILSAFIVFFIHFISLVLINKYFGHIDVPDIFRAYTFIFIVAMAIFLHGIFFYFVAGREKA